VIYVTATLPFGRPEAFLIPEIARVGGTNRVRVVPVRPRGEVVHSDAEPLVPGTIREGLFSVRVLAGALAAAVSSPGRTWSALAPLRHSRSPRILAKNLMVFPKGLWLGRIVDRGGWDHIHAHWASTSATVAMVAARYSGTPWSFTAHRWDITEDNLLPTKVRSAAFVRAISQRGAQTITARIRQSAAIDVIHVGVAVPTQTAPTRSPGFQVVAIADLVEVKGHRHLLDAVALLRNRGSQIHLELAGDGPLRESLEDRVERLGLSSCVSFLGTRSHAQVLDWLSAGRWNAVVLPSVRLGDVSEGIPISLVEAMAAGVPVVATDTGAIGELIDDGSGLLVEGGSAVALADALWRIETISGLGPDLATGARSKVEREFDIGVITETLLRRMAECG
jgi:glycosyltransferase involved in cell wall biosynthesis